MARSLNSNVRVTGPLSEFVAGKVGDDGAYENVSEYVRDLIRRDKDHAEREAFERLMAELTRAFSAPQNACGEFDADTVIARNPLR